MAEIWTWTDSQTYFWASKVQYVVGPLLDRVNHDAVLVDNLIHALDVHLLDSRRLFYHADEADDFIEPSSERVELAEDVVLAEKGDTIRTRQLQWINDGDNWN